MFNPVAALNNVIERRFNRWLELRIRPEKQLSLGQKRIYILPSKAGLFLFFLILALLVMAINFQNNLVYMFTFWLLALLVINVLFVWPRFKDWKEAQDRLEDARNVVRRLCDHGIDHG